MFRLSTTLSTVALAGLLAWPLAVSAGSPGTTPVPHLPPPKAAPPRPPAESLCESLGSFAYVRVVDRHNGWLLADMLAHTRQIQALQGMAPAIRAYQEHIVRSVWASSPALLPDVARELTYGACLEEMATGGSPLARTPVDAQRRY